jgi:hypothetical protein
LFTQLLSNFSLPSLKLKIGALSNWPSPSGYCPRPSIAPEFELSLIPEFYSAAGYTPSAQGKSKQ